VPTPRKSLEDLVADRTFLARRKRHRELLDGVLVRDPALRAIQRSYQQETSSAEGYLLAQQFEKQVRAGVQAPQLELTHLLRASIGPNLKDFVDLGWSQKKIDALDVEWQAWDILYGLAWRAQNELLCNPDRLALAQGKLDATKLRSERLPPADRIPEFLERFWPKWKRDKPRRDRLWREWRAKRGYPELADDDEIPAPPGLELVE
jgi:hypothetical protein